MVRIIASWYLETECSRAAAYVWTLSAFSFFCLYSHSQKIIANKEAFGGGVSVIASAAKQSLLPAQRYDEIRDCHVVSLLAMTGFAFILDPAQSP